MSGSGSNAQALLSQNPGPEHSLGCLSSLCHWYLQRGAMPTPTQALWHMHNKLF